MRPGAELSDEDEEEAEEDEEELGAVDVPDVEALADSEFTDDKSEANGSSIAFLAEFDGKRVLFAADAHVGRLLDALDRVSPQGRLALDLFKISHHGSRSTTSRQLIEKVDCPRFIFSTKGSIFKHPHAEAVARVIKAGGDRPEIAFNYSSPVNAVWDLIKDLHGYTTRYPVPGSEGIEIEL